MTIIFFVFGFYCCKLLVEIKTRNSYRCQIDEIFNELKNNDYFTD